MVGMIIQEVTTSVLALLAVAGMFLIVFYQLEHGGTVAIPDVVSLLVGAVVGAYFGKTISQNGARQAGTAAAQTAIAAASKGNGNVPIVAPPA